MSEHTWRDALYFIADYSELLTIGGGEPTCHPQFFDILKAAIPKFDSILIVTNGKKTQSVRRLARILLEEDHDSDEVLEDEGNYIYAEGKLSVDISTDSYHEPIDQNLKNYWEHMVMSKVQGFGVRNVASSYNGVSATGRAKRTQVGYSSHCVCPDHIIAPDGKIKMCGCERSPVIGTVRRGFNSVYEKLQGDQYRDCIKDFSKKDKSLLRKEGAFYI